MDRFTLTRDNNMDFMRLIAAIMVLYGHSFALSGHRGGPVVDWQPFDSVGGAAVAVFFVISGYLITASYARSPSIWRYLWHRALRVFPALIVVVTLSALVLGPLVSSFSLEDYFNHPGTWHYFTSIYLYPPIQYLPPGIFEGLPYPVLNGSLWTLPVEVGMYLVIACMGLMRLLNRWVVLALWLAGSVAHVLYKLQLAEFPELYLFSNHGLVLKNAVYFLAGAAIYLWRDIVPRHWSVVAFIAAVLALCGYAGWYPMLVFAVVFPYLVMWFALLPLGPLQRAGRYGDFSYGIYIYAFPIQNALLWFMPGDWNVYVYALVSLLVTLPFAVASWYWVEAPSLRLKNWRWVRRAAIA